jgi:hypothetical protein
VEHRRLICRELIFPEFDVGLERFREDGRHRERLEGEVAGQGVSPFEVCCKVRKRGQ